LIFCEKKGTANTTAQGREISEGGYSSTRTVLVSILIRSHGSPSSCCTVH